MLALIVECLWVRLQAFRGVFERVPVEDIDICAAGGDDDDASVMVRRRLDSLEQGGHEQLGEEEGADDVGAPLQVVAVLRELVDGREHYTPGKYEKYTSWWPHARTVLRSTYALLKRTCSSLSLLRKSSSTLR